MMMEGEEAAPSSCDHNSLLERLRHENLEQFLTLVRMHLSFVVDINTDECVDSSSDKPKQFRWGFNKKSKNTPTSATITTDKKPDTHMTDQSLTKIYELIDFLMEDENVRQEGIFRRTGSVSRQQELKALVSSGADLHLHRRFSVHDAASVLKSFLADLPQPLLTDQYYQTYCTLAGQYPSGEESCEKLVTALQLLVLLVPVGARALLRRLLTLLRHTAAHETSNRMSPDTLATMFTPHLLCPRRLAPETLHADAVSLAPIVSFMIRHAERLFAAPAPLATDAAAYLAARARRRALDLDDSISDRTAARTVYTFVDRDRTSAENEADPTDAALAQLYAHIQAMPDSNHKRRLVKQFNRHNGCGSPLQASRGHKSSRRIGDSIKRHILHKALLNRTPRKSVAVASTPGKSSCHSSTPRSPAYDSEPSGDRSLRHRFVSEPNLSAAADTETPKSRKRTRTFARSHESGGGKVGRRSLARSGCVSCGDDDSESSPARTPDMSPITQSTHKLPRAMQESIMTPRSRKPLVMRSDQPNAAAAERSPPSPTSPHRTSPANDSDFVSSSESDSSLSSEFRRYLRSRSVLTAAPFDLSLPDPASDSLMLCLDGHSPPHPTADKENVELWQTDL